MMHSIKERKDNKMHYSKLLKVTGGINVSPVNDTCDTDTNNIMTFLKELAEKTGLSESGVKWQLDKLKKEQKILRAGGTFGGHWVVKK